MTRVFVTGGSGFIGTNLVQSLLDDGFEVRNFDHRPPANRVHARHYIAGDILDLDSLRAAVRSFQPAWLVHLAARCDLHGGSLEDYAANTTGVRNIMSAVRNQPSIERVIFTSSRYVHPTATQPQRDDDYAPFTFYGASKVEGENIVRSSELDVPWVIVRPTSIWGPWFGIPYRGFFDALRRGFYVHPQGERVYKTYGYVGNVVHQMKRLLFVPAENVHGRTLYVADYQPTEVMDMAETIRDAFKAPPVRQVPVGVLRMLASAGDAARKLGWKNPPMTSFRLNNLRTQMVYDISATQAVAGPSPYTLQQGIHNTVVWMQQYG